MTRAQAITSSPLGPLLVIWQGDALCLLDFADNQDRIARLSARHFSGQRPTEKPLPQAMQTALDSYFNHRDDAALMALPIARQGTEFQRQCWAELRHIKAGSPISYADLARRIGKPTGFRAVARANALNPISLAVPCHRVIASDGTLGGYAGGLSRKQWLLDHEAAQQQAMLAI